MNNIEEILLKLNKTQSMIEGIRLGISVSASTSQPLQNIEHILKLISADLIDITNLVSENKQVLEKEIQQDIKELPEVKEEHIESVQEPTQEVVQDDTINPEVENGNNQF